MALFEGVTANQMGAIASGWIPNELSNRDKSVRDFLMAQKLRVRAEEVRAAGNIDLADKILFRANDAAKRAARYFELSYQEMIAAKGE